MYNTETRASLKQLPDDFADPHLLVIGLDQGPSCTAGQAFAEHHLNAMILPKYCKFHRVVRDVKLSVLHASNGLFLKAQLFSNNLWAVNKRPFNTGKFGEDKKRLLNIFLSAESWDGSLFQKHGHRVALDFKMPFETDEERRAVWDRVALLPTFREAGEAT